MRELQAFLGCQGIWMKSSQTVKFEVIREECPADNVNSGTADAANAACVIEHDRGPEGQCSPRETRDADQETKTREASRDDAS